MRIKTITTSTITMAIIIIDWLNVNKNSQKPCPKFINISEHLHQLSLIKEVINLNKTNVFKVCWMGRNAYIICYKVISLHH